MTTKEASTLKYIGVYLLAVFPYNLVSTILVGLTAEAMFTNLSVAIIITIFDLAIWCGIFIYVYSRFDDINVHKVMPYVAIFVVLGILYTLYIFGPLSFLDNYYFIVFLAIAEPIAFLYIFYNYFQTKTYNFI
jgi:hypothetical protein